MATTYEQTQTLTVLDMESGKAAESSCTLSALRDGKPLVLESVREAERRIYEAKMNHEYAGIVGVADFNKLSLQFAYGADSAPIAEGRVAVTQTLSGTGACRLVGEFLSRFVGAGSPIYLPNPTWGNHIPIMKDAGLEVRLRGGIGIIVVHDAATGFVAEVQVADFAGTEPLAVIVDNQQLKRR